MIYAGIFSSILVEMKGRKVCCMIPTIYTNITEINNGGEDSYDYLRQLCCCILEYSNWYRKKEMSHDYSNKVQLFIKLTMMERTCVIIQDNYGTIFGTF